VVTHQGGRRARKAEHMDRVVIGTRGSALALAQSEMVKRALLDAERSLVVDLAIIQTEGDRKQGAPQAAQSDKKDWIVDLEQALVRGEIDLAVHSGKDVPGELESGTAIKSILKRANPCDVFIGRRTESGKRLSFADLPHGAIVGTASLRRRASLRAYRPDLVLKDHRGNVPTRIKKLDESEDLAGIVLAAAGLERLGLQDVEWEAIDKAIMLPAMNQGALAAQVRADDTRTNSLIDRLADRYTAAEFHAERAVAEILGGDCHSAISIFAEARGESISVEGRVFSIDGAQVITYSSTGSIDQADEIGASVGREILARGAADLLG
jgi:hydroxymethylbilane synthase